MSVLENGHDPSACCNSMMASILFGFCASDLGGLSGGGIK